MVYPEPGFELHQRQGDTSYAQMFTDIGVYYAPAAVLRGEEFNGAEAVHRLEPVAEPGGAGGAQAPPTTLASMEAPLQILWRKKKEGENFEEEEGMRRGRRKKERRAPLALDPGSTAARMLSNFVSSVHDFSFSEENRMQFCDGFAALVDSELVIAHMIV